MSAVRKRLTTLFSNHYPNLEVPRIEVTEGRRYWKVVEYSSQGTVHGFVDKTNGDVLKAETFYKPAKHARGNVLSEENGMEAITPNGHVRYLS